MYLRIDSHREFHSPSVDPADGFVEYNFARTGNLGGQDRRDSSIYERPVERISLQMSLFSI